ncbi:unnamed protein product [Bursaphelenchus okinawaensis]|uniref:DNA polymerase n=1 Tax=Bursaphelenchus okinawaensis TaxID=465554 RepID=A0A811L0H9_9BILA|nr:unnamed protein product [Bursaphelenchus okinawaensis]CAG9114771.1 unnamed protein product [Bursaphelenchus okinawaensis]
MATKYGRTAVPDDILLEQSVDIAFQLIDVDYIQEEFGVRIRLFGTTKDGHSICASAKTYVPYLYMEAPKNHKTENIGRYVDALNERLLQLPEGQRKQYAPPGTTRFVLSIEEVKGKNLMHYQKDDQTILKINVVSPKVITACKTAYNASMSAHLTCFEANIDFETRFMADLNMVGCCWIQVIAKKYQTIDNNHRETICQIEAQTDIKDLVVHPAEDPWDGIAPLRTLSFDIEVAGRPGVFPEAKQDPVIQIACVCKTEGEAEPFSRICFVLGGCNPVKGSDIVCCKKEEELLKKFTDYFCKIDPDVVTGYNVQNFDFPYILDRAKALNINKDVAGLGRLKGVLAKVKENTVSSAQMGTRVNKVITLEGRMVFDVFRVITREYKLRSYTLNNVSYNFLGEQKEDVPYQMITGLHQGTDQDRRRLAVYCLKDAYLPLKLIEKLMLLINYIEMARVTGVPLNFLIERGQQVKILSQLLRKTKTTGYFIPVIEKSGGGGPSEGYEGATVLDPITGFYNQPIATLDFASLYPSIMIAHNLCYTTLLAKPLPKGFAKDDDYVESPTHHTFVTTKHRKGLLPMILEDLLGARKKAKKDLKEATDPLKKMVLNGRQLALKISANSVYGFTGATVGKLPCVEISESVTSFGREMIEKTKECVEATYKNGQYGAPGTARVIYGDTDSVMVEFGCTEISEAMQLGKHAAELISKEFKAPIKLEFEKVYCPYLLMAKKRYAGLYFTRPEKHDKVDTKGLETVRRDNCSLVGSVMQTCLDLLLIKRDPTAAIEYAKRVIGDLLCNRIDMGMLIITKEYTQTGDKSKNKSAHIALVEKLRKRDAGSAPKLGDRISYIMVHKGNNVPAYEKAEDPRYALENNMPLDTKYYLENQLLNPLVRLLDPLTNNKAKDILLKGDHARVKAHAASKSGIGMFFKKVETCIACKSTIQVGAKSPLCQHCQPKIGNIYAEKVNQLKIAEHKYSRLWTECQNCANDFTNEVVCASSDCPIFWLREKARSDMAERREVLDKFYEM